MKEKPNIWWPIGLMVVFALTRWPGLFPMEWQNFSAAYAMAFCAGVYFPPRLALLVPLGTLALTDILINLYYYYYRGIDAFQWFQVINYVSYAVIICLGIRFRRSTSWHRLLAGGICGAIIFYLLTNTAAWFFNPFGNPEYSRDLSGWFVALTKGTAGYPPTWQFFRNTLLSGGLFTGLFVAAMKWVEQTEPEPQPAPEEEPLAEPKESQV